MRLRFLVLSGIILMFQLVSILPSLAGRGRNFYDVSMIADQKARKVGDILTVQVSERSTAERKATMQTSRASDRSGKLSGLAGIPVKGLGNGIGLTSESKFDGEGSSSRSEQFNATVPVMILEILPSGNFVVEGQRSLKVNGENQTISVKGIVRAKDITHRNTIVSTNLANAEINYDGKGIINRQQKPGVISRLLDWIWIF